MKLVIQVPCWNEAGALPALIPELPRHIDGVDSIAILVIDDGSADDTADVARASGADYVVRLNGHQGLARAFMMGIVAAVERGADVIVNIDADGQHCPKDIARLITPILERKADIVIGARPIRTVTYFSPFKRLLQVWGSRAVRALSGTDVRDAASGYRAMTRDAALRLNVFGDYTYTIETAIQAGWYHLRVASIPIRANGPTRPSRLVRSNLGYVYRAARTMLNLCIVYRPTRLLALLSSCFIASGLTLGLRYGYLWQIGQGQNHIPSLMFCGGLIICGAYLAAAAVVTHLQSINRMILEEVRYLTRTARRANSRAGGCKPDPFLRRPLAEGRGPVRVPTEG
jgi:glycosyltransferase involved in cell wall biosynthesis